MSTLLELFLVGLAMGAGPCSFTCLPILVPYIAGSREGLREGVKATLAFSFSRLSAYVLLGLAAGLWGEHVVAFVSRAGFSYVMGVLAGAVIIALGALILLGGEVRVWPYQALFRHAVSDSYKSMAFTGFLVGATPCVNLIGILTYVAFSAASPLEGALHTLSFGLGACVVTPIVAVGVVSGVLPRFVFKDSMIRRAFKKICGVLLMLLGARLIFSQAGWGPGYW